MFKFVVIFFRSFFTCISLLVRSKKYSKHKKDYSLDYRYSFLRKSVKNIGKACRKTIICENLDIMNSPHGGRIYISNHNSIDDILTFIDLSIKPLIFISKIENKNNKFLRYPCDMIDCIFIDRDNPRQSVLSLKQAAILAKENNMDVVLFPEGTRSRDGEVHEFKSALNNLLNMSKVELVMLAMDGTKKAFSKGKYEKYNVRVKVFEPISYEKFLENKNGFNEYVRNIIAKQVSLFKKESRES